VQRAGRDRAEKLRKSEEVAIVEVCKHRDAHHEFDHRTPSSARRKVPGDVA
jgi:hypothetical protein